MITSERVSSDSSVRSALFMRLQPRSHVLEKPFLSRYSPTPLFVAIPLCARSSSIESVTRRKFVKSLSMAANCWRVASVGSSHIDHALSKRASASVERRSMALSRISTHVLIGCCLLFALPSKSASVFVHHFRCTPSLRQRRVAEYLWVLSNPLAKYKKK